MLKAGVFWKSSKKNEKRIPIHPSMFSNIETDLRSHVFFESGYGKDLGLSDDFFFQHFGGAMSRQQLFESTDVWMLPKPTIVGPSGIFMGEAVIRRSRSR
jgi:alanine dehydrogenase